MSRIGKKPVSVPSGVTVSVHARQVTVKGPKGTLSWTHPVLTKVAYDEVKKSVVVTRTEDTGPGRACHGLTRALVNNMVAGVTLGFRRRLLIYGTGYNCKLQGRTLHLNIGYSGRRRGLGAQFELKVPEGIEIVVEKDAARGETDPASLTVSGCDKQKVGQFAAEIRALRKTEPYKGKGIRYEGETVRRKQGKTLTGGS